jgi:hypothetical protein
MPLYDYRVSRIAETINEVAIAIQRVAQWLKQSLINRC